MKFRDKTTGEIISDPIEVLKRVPELQHLRPLGHALRILPSVSGEHGYDFIYPTAQPAVDKKNQHVKEGPPEFVDGKWQEKWEVKPGKDPKYKEPKYKEPKPRPGRGGMGFGRRFSY